MAKWCEACKQSYADDQVSCPRCAARVAETEIIEAVEVVEEPLDVAELVPERPKPGPSDSAIDLGSAGRPHTGAETGQAPLSESGQSAIEWASLVEDEPPSGRGSVPVVDSPSDKDLIARALAEEAARPKMSAADHDSGHALAGDLQRAQELAAEQGAKGRGAAGPSPELHSQSMIDLTRGDRPPGASSGVDVRQLAEEVIQAELVEEAGEPSVARADSSGIDLGDLALAKSSGTMSDVEVISGTNAPVSDVEVISGHDVRMSDVDVLSRQELGSSDVDVLSGHGTSRSDVEVVSGPGLGSSDVDVLSGRDLIAEAVESGVDPRLSAPQEGGASGQDSGDKVDLAEAEVVKDSSEVELGGKRTHVARPEDVEDAVADDPSGADAGSDPGEGSGIDFGPFPVGRVSSGSIHPGSADSGSNVDLGDPDHSAPEVAMDSNPPAKGSDSSIDLGSTGDQLPVAGSDELGERIESEEEPAPVAATRGARPAPAPRPTIPSGGGRGWVGWAGGALMGAGACVALWTFGVQPPAGMRLFGDDAKKPAALNVGNPSASTAANDVVAQKLIAGGVIDNAQDAERAIDQLLGARKAADDEMARLKTEAEQAGKQAGAARTEIEGLKKQLAAATGGAGDVKAKLDAAEKKAEAALADAANQKKTADAARIEGDGLKEKLVAADKNAQAAAAKLKNARNNVQRLTADKNKADALLQKIAEDLVAAKFLDPKADRAALAQGLQDALKTASTVDAGGRLREMQAEVNRAKEQLDQRWQPTEMLAVWLPVLNNRGNRALATKAVADANRVLSDGKATAAQKAQAQAVLGLALRNQEKFAEAKAALEKAKAGLKGGNQTLAARVDAALKEVADPSGSFVTRAEDLRGRDRNQQALTLLERGLKAMPAAGRAPLLAERSLLRLEMAREKGAVKADDPAVAAARKDAEEAAKAGLAEGHYAAGRIAEELGQTDEATGHYRKALAAHPDLDAAGGRYRIALARVLVGPRQERPSAPRSAASAPVDSLDAALPLLILGLQGPGPATGAAARAEAERLADEILSAKEGTVPFDLRAKALAIKGQHSQALRVYVQGLRSTLPRGHADSLLEIIDNHPALKGQSAPLATAAGNPLEAEQHYSVGLRWYFARDYAKAAKEFQAAVANDGQDARYFYFLGLTRLARGDREAYGDFEQAARLERRNRPSREAVSAALERVQGPMRRVVNEIRSQPEK